MSLIDANSLFDIIKPTQKATKELAAKKQQTPHCLFFTRTPIFFVDEDLHPRRLHHLIFYCYEENSGETKAISVAHAPVASLVLKGAKQQHCLVLSEAIHPNQ